MTNLTLKKKLEKKNKPKGNREGLKFRKNRKGNEEFLFCPKTTGNVHPY